jgi:hypothetical protein
MGLKIIQEIMRSRPVILVCGKDLFHSWEIEAIMNDIGGMPEPGEYPQRTRELGMRERPSFYFDMIVSHDLTFSKTIWSVMRTFVSHHCSDPRDRVFGLLALVDPEYREAFRPDYTKSATAVLLQVIEHHAEMDKGEDSSGNFFWARTRRTRHCINAGSTTECGSWSRSPFGHHHSDAGPTAIFRPRKRSMLRRSIATGLG